MAWHGGLLLIQQADGKRLISIVSTSCSSHITQINSRSTLQVFVSQYPKANSNAVSKYIYASLFMSGASANWPFEAGNLHFFHHFSVHPSYNVQWCIFSVLLLRTVKENLFYTFFNLMLWQPTLQLCIFSRFAYIYLVMHCTFYWLTFLPYFVIIHYAFYCTLTYSVNFKILSLHFSDRTQESIFSVSVLLCCSQLCPLDSSVHICTL